VVYSLRCSVDRAIITLSTCVRSKKAVTINASSQSVNNDCRLRLRKSDDNVIISRDHARDLLDRMATRFASQQVLHFYLVVYNYTNYY